MEPEEVIVSAVRRGLYIYIVTDRGSIYRFDPETDTIQLILNV